MLDNVFKHVEEMGFYVVADGTKFNGDFVVTRLIPKVSDQP